MSKQLTTHFQYFMNLIKKCLELKMKKHTCLPLVMLEYHDDNTNTNLNHLLE